MIISFLLPERGGKEGISTILRHNASGEKVRGKICFFKSNSYRRMII
ncbi:MAG: hypothetical protein LBR79_00710 [Oscillospiraceae bacterium]|nr:hypothetical protein [Oscillospiraceae bacterium]